MQNFLLKLFVCLGTVYLADMLSPQINFYFFGDIILIGVLIGLISYIGDVFFLQRSSNLTLIWFDVIMATAVIWASSWFLETAYITFSGSLFSGILIGFTSYIVRSYSLARRKREII